MASSISEKISDLIKKSEEKAKQGTDARFPDESQSLSLSSIALSLIALAKIEYERLEAEKIEESMLL